MKFIGRVKEQERINKMLLTDELSAGLIFGRRRIGKTELIKNVLRHTDIPGIYYECKETTEQNNVDSIALLISEHFGYPKPAFQNIEELLNFLFKESENHRFIFILDEYPYLQKEVKGLDSILQTLIDHYKDTSKIKLILCGSSIDTMRSLLERQNPLFGRMDMVLSLKAMDYMESQAFYPEFSAEDKVRIYSVFGGIPYYNRLIDDKKSVRENIMDLIVSPGSRLENEVPMYLKSELSKIVNANEVFESLARGFSRYSDILSQSHVSSSPALADTLEKLCSLELVNKTVPINDESNRKRISYHIYDNLSSFYYRYIFPYTSQRNVMDPEIFYNRYIAEDLESSFIPKGFEGICTQYLINQNRAGLLEEPFEKIGRNAYDDPIRKKNGEFDIITKDMKGYIFYEVKFRKHPVDVSTINKEIEQVCSTGMNCYRFGFFSRSGFTKDVTGEHLLLYTIDDLY